MSGQDRRPAAENPFSSCRVRPGAIPFISSAAHENVATLVARLGENNWWGQIVGPHGSGKSALLAAVIPAIERAGRRVVAIELHDAERRLPAEAWHQAASTRATLLGVDGYEQLSWRSRWRLKRFCRRQDWGLLITTHAPAGLPDLHRCTVDLALAMQIVADLQRGYPRLTTDRDVAECLARHQGNMRETLFDLYDLYEARRGGAG